MVTRLGLLLVKPCAKRNSINQLLQYFSKFGRVVHKNNTHKTMKPDFFCGCHGNREPTNQDIFNHNSNLKIDIKNPASWLCSPMLAYHLCKNFMAVQLFRFWVTFGTMLQLCTFCYFEILTKTFLKNLKIGKLIKLVLKLNVVIKLLKIINLQTFWAHFG